jgi:hypothetical protein
MDQGTDNPFIARPEEHTVGAANELYCWMPGNADRECNASCVAYDVDIMETTGGPCLALGGFCRAVEAFSRAHKQAAVREKVQGLAQAIGQIPSPPEVK